MSEKLSLLVSHILDKLGYNEEMRHYRLDKYSDLNYAWSLSSHNVLFTYILGGSKSEGASKCGESDFDILYVLNSVQATKRADILGDKLLTLYIEDETTPPGYCKLRLKQCAEDNIYHKMFSQEECYVKCPGYDRPHLSSTLVLNALHEVFQSLFPGQVGGPAHKSQNIDGFDDTDTVFAIRCDHIPNAFKQWLRRHQRHAWPARIMEHLAQSHVFLVPAGKHSSHYQYLEWRISFNLAEKILIANFTAVQYQVYILMKKILKEVIQPRCPESITSYIIKTLMLWVVETIPVVSWRKDKLIDAVLYVLNMLHRCVQQNVCPMYFIPEDNILEGRLKEETRRDVFHIVSTLLKCGMSCVLQVPSLANQIYNFMAVGVPTPMHDILVAQQEEKAHILVHNSKRINDIGKAMSCRAVLFRCQDGSVIPYRVLLADLVRASPSPCKRGIVEHIFDQTFSQYCLQQCADSDGIGSNIQKYASVRNSLALLYQKHRNNVLNGRLRLAQVLYFLGQYREAQNVLEKYVKRNHLFQAADRRTVQKPTCTLRLLNVLGNECLSTTDILKYFLLEEIIFDDKMEAILPCALNYELYKPDSPMNIVEIDPEPLFYYLQYICSTKLGQRRKAASAIEHLTWCATSIDSNIEYREVALNVLAHCMLKKGLYDLAAKLLIRSKMLYKQYRHAPFAEALTYNAAIWHMAILLNKLLHNQ